MSNPLTNWGPAMSDRLTRIRSSHRGARHSAAAFLARSSAVSLIVLVLLASKALAFTANLSASPDPNTGDFALM